MAVDDAKKLKALEQENAKLKKLLAEKLLDIEVLKDINSKKMVSAPARRGQVAHARKRWKLSLRRVRITRKMSPEIGTM